ncbi:MAG: hypothetical protein J6X57_05000 [Bacteroidales bacterium]|nr:hypothetical protein [Bacteroidales bacterium]
MKIKFMYLIAIAAMLFAAGCKKNQPLTETEQKDKLEDVGIELLEYADVSKWGDAYAAFTKFEKIVTDETYDQSVLENIEVETKEESGVEDDYVNYGWYCSYQAPGTFTFERAYTIQLADVKGSYSLDATKKAWVKEDAATLTIKADVDGVPNEAHIAITTNSTKSLLSESTDMSYNEWPAYTTGPAMYYQKNHHEENGGWDSYDPVTRTEGNVTQYHIYNPVTNADLGWFSDSDYYNNYSTYCNMVSVPAGRHERVRKYLNYIHMPKNIKADFKKGNEKIADVNVNIDYKAADAAKIDIAKDQVNVDFSFAASGYTLKSTKTNYLTDGAETYITFDCGKKRIFSLSAQEKGFKLESKLHENKYDNDSGNGYKNGSCNSSTTYKISTMPKSAEFIFNLLGEVKVTGSADIATASELSEKLDTIRANEAEFKATLAQAEKTIKIKAFYNGSKKCSAHFGLEPVKDENSGLWEAVPVIRFDEGGNFALFEEFFDETDFPRLIKAIEDWQKSVDNYIASIFPKEN